jgi:hypothetical protein
MAITIRNKDTEAIIRRLGKRWNEGPSGVVSRLAKQEEQRAEEVDQAEKERRMKAWDELMALAPPRDPNLTWQDIEKEMDSLFDYFEEDGGQKPR